MRFLSAIFLCAASVFAQNASLSGIVRDSSQAAVPGAAITLHNDGSGAELTTMSSSEGVYSFPFVVPGRYAITARLSGFQTITNTGIKIDIDQTARIDFALKPGILEQSVTVSSESSILQSDASGVSTVIDRHFLENLPLNGRSFQSLIALTPGVVMTQASFGEQGQFSVNGQRANANYFTIDGAGANIGVSAGLTLVQSATGSLPGLGATGGTNTLVAVEAMEEFRVQTSGYAPEYGRMPGAQISILTRSGTNKLHGSLFDFFRNDKLDANDWFANQQALPKPALRQNDFGGVLGGPVIIPRLYNGRDKTFFFFSYEGLRLRQPQVQATDVPSLPSRRDAPEALQPFLNSFPLPNRPPSRLGFAPFVARYTDLASLDATSVRFDHRVNDHNFVFARFNFAPSVSTARLYALNNPTDTFAGTTTFTAGWTSTLSPRLSNDLRLNYSVTTGSSFSRLDDFGGAQPLAAQTLFPANIDIKDAFGGFFLTAGINSSYYLGKNVANRQHQYNFVDTFSVAEAGHQTKFGIDYRRVGTYSGPRRYDQFAYFTTPNAALGGLASTVVVEAQDPGSIVLRNFSAFAQDAWKIRQNLTLTYGVRWEVNPAPEGGPGHALYTLENYRTPKQLKLAPVGTPLYRTTWRNFAPRAGVAWQGKYATLRGGFGMFYDLGSGLLGQTASSFPYYRSTTYFDGVKFPLSLQAAQPPPLSTTPSGATIYGAVPGLRLPVTYQWNVSVERAFARVNALTVSYVGAAGRNLLRQDYLINPNPSFTYAYLVKNTAFSDFHSLQAQFQRRLSRGVQALVSYTWAHSLDNASNDSGSHLSAIQVDPANDRGASDFDIRHTLSAAFRWDLPKPGDWARFTKPVLRDWALDGVVITRTATPVAVTYTRDLGFGVYSFRPDWIAGQPLYVPDPNAPGGRRFNADAFELPIEYPGRQGTLGRNALRGFNLNQLNLTIRREFPLRERLKLQFRAEMFNALNHPDFADPIGSLLSSQFGVSTKMLGRSLGRGGVNGGLNPLFQLGGPRSVQLAARLVF